MDERYRAAAMFYVVFVVVSILINTSGSGLTIGAVLAPLVIGVPVALLWHWAMQRFVRGQR